jgi:uncharacterized protein with PIN domain
VVRECGLKLGDNLFTRCVECNTVLQPRPKETLESVVPRYVFSSQETFFSCPTCQRIYWPATHHEKMLDELRNLGLG